MTSRVINGLRPYTSYSVSMTSLDADGVEGPRSMPTEPRITNEAG